MSLSGLPGPQPAVDAVGMAPGSTTSAAQPEPLDEIAGGLI